MSATGRLQLSDWHLPPAVVGCYEGVGISRLFPWQADCLSLEGVLDGGRNLVYCAPTGAGKTLVAEIVVLKRVLDTRRKALIILPFVSVAREKMLYLQRVYRKAGVRVEGYMGTSNPVGGVRGWDVAVATMEKAGGLVNRLVEENALHNIGTVVVDELHTVSDPSRGYLLELLITKLLFLNGKDPQLAIQIIGMSATLPDMPLLARWLKAALYRTDYRPVPLRESLLTGKRFHDPARSPTRELDRELIIAGDTEHVVGTCLETMLTGHGVLIFCSTKAWCERLSQTIAKTFCAILTTTGPLTPKLKSVLDAERQAAFFEDYKRSVPMVDPVLARTLRFAVCFHHAGLTMEERELLESGFRRGDVRVVVATSTLSSGVNLPAKRVVIRSPWGQPSKPGPLLTPATYRQMIGRAGRKGLDDRGESVLMCKSTELERGFALMNAALPPLNSVLLPSHFFQKAAPSANGQPAPLSPSIKRAVLEIVVSGLARSVEAVRSYLCSSLMAILLAESDSEKGSEGASELQIAVVPVLESCFHYLLTNEFIHKCGEGDGFGATQLGSASLASSLGPDESLAIYRDLARAQRQGLILDTELHLVYLVTPIYVQDGWGREFSWAAFYEHWCRLDVAARRVAEAVGVEERFLIRKAHSTRTTTMIGAERLENERKEAIHMRFYTALALLELVGETALVAVAAKFGCNRGFLQQLQQQSSTYAAMVVTFCDRLGWCHLRSLLAGFAERLSFGVRGDLTELVRVDGLDGLRARRFHAAGITTLAKLVQAEPAEVLGVLRKAVPFQRYDKVKPVDRFRRATLVWRKGDLTELVRVDGLDGLRARRFHAAGITTLAKLVQAEPAEVLGVLRKAVPFQSMKASTDKHCWLANHPDVTDTEAVSLIQARAKTVLHDSLLQLGLTLPSDSQNILSTKSQPSSEDTECYDDGPLLNKSDLRAGEDKISENGSVIVPVESETLSSADNQSSEIMDKGDRLVVDTSGFKSNEEPMPQKCSSVCEERLKISTRISNEQDNHNDPQISGRVIDKSYVGADGDGLILRSYAEIEEGMEKIEDGKGDANLNQGNFEKSALSDLELDNISSLTRDLSTISLSPTAMAKSFDMNVKSQLSLTESEVMAFLCDSPLNNPQKPPETNQEILNDCPLDRSNVSNSSKDMFSDIEEGENQEIVESVMKRDHSETPSPLLRKRTKFFENFIPANGETNIKTSSTPTRLAKPVSNLRKDFLKLDCGEEEIVVQNVCETSKSLADLLNSLRENRNEMVSVAFSYDCQKAQLNGIRENLKSK